MSLDRSSGVEAAAKTSTSPGSGLLQRKCACGSKKSPLEGTCEKCGSHTLQRKLAVGAGNDSLEQEADRVADQVLMTQAQPAIAASTPRIQRAATHGGVPASAAPPSVDAALSAAGRPLEPDFRQEMEQRFGHSFSAVRVHTHAAAERSARDVNAHAYTVGHDIVFGQGRFSPGTSDGRRLIAHELTHVVQQGQGESSMLQRDASDKPCGPFAFSSDWSIYGDIVNGPYQDQGIKISYDKIAPYSDPMKDFDAAESKKVFNTPAMLEQVYFDATQPMTKFFDRHRAAWWICNVVEPVAQEIGYVHARGMYSLGCMTIQNCGINWNVPFANFSDRTASGMRIRALAYEGFTEKAFELGLAWQVINSVLMLAGGLKVARAGLNAPKVAAPTKVSTPPRVEKPPAIEKPPVVEKPSSVKPPVVESPAEGPSVTRKVKKAAKEPVEKDLEKLSAKDKKKNPKREDRQKAQDNARETGDDQNFRNQDRRDRKRGDNKPQTKNRREESPAAVSPAGSDTEFRKVIDAGVKRELNQAGVEKWELQSVDGPHPLAEPDPRLPPGRGVRYHAHYRKPDGTTADISVNYDVVDDHFGTVKPSGGKAP